MTDDELMDEIASALSDGLEQHVRPWLRGLLLRRAGDGARRDAVEAVVDEIASPLVERVRALLTTDIDEQRANPLAVVRAALGPATEFLRSLDIPHVERDPFVVQAFPDDVYDLAPATFGDIHESLQDAGLRWGAAKAHLHLRRRRAEGLR